MNIKGMLWVLCGAISFGIPASVFKLAINQGSHIANLQILQFVFAVIFLAVIKQFQPVTMSQKLNTKNKRQLFFSGLTITTTSIFYFSSLSYVSVAITAVMIMQSVWIAMIYGLIFKRIMPNLSQIIAVIIVMFGTVLSTQLFSYSQDISWVGILLGLGSACCYAGTIIVTNSVANHGHPIHRSFYISSGAGFFVILFWLYQFDTSSILTTLKWGPIMAILSVVLPLYCFSKGMPMLSPAMGGLLSSIELPSAIIFAYILLQESISVGQLIGIILILFAIAFPDLIRLIAITKRKRVLKKTDISSVKINRN